MYAQSKGRQFETGQHNALVTYLTQTCPLDPDQETEQDRKLNLILSKVQEHQSSLRQLRTVPGESHYKVSLSDQLRAISVMLHHVVDGKSTRNSFLRSLST